MDIQSLKTTDFNFQNQTRVYHGKVRDTYTIDNDKLISIATDRISAFDVILPRAIPYKGQILNQTAAHFLNSTSDIVPNWLDATPDPNVSIGKLAEPYKVEVVVRGVLVGHAWREYANGRRELCGAIMPDGLKEYSVFPMPLITPSTKADEGHDEDISEADIVAKGLVNEDDWLRIRKYALALFAKGQEMARARGLVLADTKYEFGNYNGEIILIDEIHTPDSSRYFYLEGFDKYNNGESEETPKHLSKEFVREWLMANEFDGQGNKQVPAMTDEFVESVTKRYTELYEEITGLKFEPAETEDIEARIEQNVLNYLKENHAAN